jgi:ApaG protein
MNDNFKIAISVTTKYLSEESDQINHQHVFAYTITITNRGQLGARLLNRHWLITDGNGRTQEVHGEGVVGEQPHLKPGQNFSYTSYAIIDTPIGSMHGSYQMMSEEGELFEAQIPAFNLVNLSLIH